MQCKFKFIYLFYWCWLFSTLTPIFTLNSFAEESLRLDLTQELKKGNFLIGLKQYLGAKNYNFSEKKNITFTTKDNFLKLHSFNGVKHNSKKINIVFKKITLQTPLTIIKGNV